MRLHIAMVISLLGLSGQLCTAATTATLVLADGNVLTMNASNTVAEAVAMQGNRIIAVGNNEDMQQYVGTGTKVIHLYGKTVMPGFIDAHIHPIMGAERLGKCSADDVAQPVATVVAKVLRECVAKEKSPSPASWIEVVNVNPSNFVATTADLDKISLRRPVILFGTDGHTAWVNSVALKLSHITDSTANPIGGQIERDAHGHATGFLKDAGQEFVVAIMPKLSLAQRTALALKAIELIRSKGITTVQDAWAGPEEMEVYEALEKSNQLRMRVRATLRSTITEDEAEFQRLVAIRKHFEGHPLVRADAVKIFSDGVLEFPTQTAAMITPYLDGKGNPTDNFGGRYFKEATLNNYVARLDKEGFTIHVHSIGDYTTHAALNAFQFAQDQNGVKDNRHQITHLQIVDPADYPRFAKLNVYADMQLFWAFPEEYSVEAVQPYISKESFSHMYPAASLKKAGAVIVGASDWPVDAAPGNPMPNTPLSAIQTAVTRKNVNPGSKYVGMVLNPDERLDVNTMLAAYTINAAKALKQEQSTGSIEVGKLADLVILARNPITSPVEKLADIPIQTTIFDGAIVYKFNADVVAR